MRLCQALLLLEVVAKCDRLEKLNLANNRCALPARKAVDYPMYGDIPCGSLIEFSGLVWDIWT